VAEVLDAYALVALIADEPAAQIVEDILRAGDAAMTSINLGEAVDVSSRVHGLAEDTLRGIVEPLLLGGHLAVIAPDQSSAWRAAHLRTVHYSRSVRPISIADCFLLAAAGLDDRIATADPSVAEVARAEGIALLALPDSTGRRP
jgi:predicted nucleic acid-binding protein